MKKIISIVIMVALLAVGVFALSACNENDTITMYTESGFAPYEFVSSTGNIVGVDVAIMSEVAERMGKKLKINDVAFDFITSNVASDKGLAVGAAGLSITPERQETVDFSKIYASSTLVIVSAADKAYSSVASLAGKMVAVQQGTSGDLIISDAAGAGYVYTTEDVSGNEIDVTVTAAGATVQQLQTYALCMAELSNGRVDAILMDKLPASSLVATSSNPDGYAIVDASDLLQEDFGIAFKKGADSELVNTVNEVITEWLANGNMTKYTEYYTALDAYEKGTGAEPVVPEGLKLSWNV